MPVVYLYVFFEKNSIQILCPFFNCVLDVKLQSFVYILNVNPSSDVLFANNFSLSDFPDGSDGKVSAYSAGYPGSIPGLGRSPGERNGTPLQYSCLENPMDGEAW